MFKLLVNFLSIISVELSIDYDAFDVFGEVFVGEYLSSSSYKFRYTFLNKTDYFLLSLDATSIFSPGFVEVINNRINEKNITHLYYMGYSLGNRKWKVEGIIRDGRLFGKLRTTTRLYYIDRYGYDKSGTSILSHNFQLIIRNRYPRRNVKGFPNGKKIK